MRLTFPRAGFLLLTAAVTSGVAAGNPSDLNVPLAALRNVGPEGQGHAEATAAWRVLAQREANDLPALLEAMDGANPLAKNWLRAAVESLAARTRAAGTPVPVPSLEAFLAELQHDPQARWLAYDLIAQSDPAQAESLVAGLLDDPSHALRRLAVERLMAEAARFRAEPNPAAARTRYEQALNAARDVDQIEALATALRELGVPVDLREVFGWITRWHVIGPFDNTGRAGFDQVFPPELEPRLAAAYDGKAGQVRWRELVVADEYGKVDFNPPLGASKEVTAYALAEFLSDRVQPAELRLGSKNAWKVWLNGRFLFGRDEYHRGMEIDQYRLPVTLLAGTNTLLVKVCQNEQVEDWTVEWEFQLRLTDPLGTPLRPASIPQPSPSPAPSVNGRDL